jgi:soluble lytic murein transglycosylase-like protein
MLRKILANKMARKAAVFAVTFVVAAVSLGTAMLGGWNVDLHEALGQATRGGRVPEPIPKPASVQKSSSVQELPQLMFAYADALFQLPDDYPEPAPIITPVPQIRYYSPASYWSMADEGFRYLPDIPLSEDLQRYTYMKCREIGFDYTLALAIMWGESNFRIGAVSQNPNGTSDSGIMQINDVNRDWLYRELEIDDLFNPYQNITAGLEILRRLSETHGQHNALIAYQMGEGGMLRKLESGETTSRYADWVYQKQMEIEALFAALDDEE